MTVEKVNLTLEFCFCSTFMMVVIEPRHPGGYRASISFLPGDGKKDVEEYLRRLFPEDIAALGDEIPLVLLANHVEYVVIPNIAIVLTKSGTLKFFAVLIPPELSMFVVKELEFMQIEGIPLLNDSVEETLQVLPNIFGACETTETWVSYSITDKQAIASVENFLNKFLKGISSIKAKNKLPFDGLGLSAAFHDGDLEKSFSQISKNLPVVFRTSFYDILVSYNRKEYEADCKKMMLSLVKSDGSSQESTSTGLVPFKGPVNRSDHADKDVGLYSDIDEEEELLAYVENRPRNSRAAVVDLENAHYRCDKEWVPPAGYTYDSDSSDPSDEDSKDDDDDDEDEIDVTVVLPQRSRRYRLDPAIVANVKVNILFLLMTTEGIEEAWSLIHCDKTKKIKDDSIHSVLSIMGKKPSSKKRKGGSLESPPKKAVLLIEGKKPSSKKK